MPTRRPIRNPLQMPPATLQKTSCSAKPEAPSIKSDWLSWSGKGVLTLTDQGLIGGSNFLIAILLARQLSLTQYGAYALAFEIFMVLSMAYACLILEPLLVFGPSTYRDSFRQYFGVLLWMHLGIAFATALLLGGSAWLIYELGKWPNLSSALTALMLAMPCILLFWLARRAFYVKLDPKTAVLGGLIYSSVLLGGVLLLYQLRSLSPAVAFLLMAAGALAASPLLVGRLNPSMFSKLTSPTLREVSSKHWVYGRWALSAAVAGWISGNIYYILLSTMRGLADTGSFKALLNVASPVGQVFAALFMLIIPYAARMYQQNGASGVERLSWRLTLLCSGGAVAYWFSFLVFKHPILHLLYGGKYLQIEHLVPYVALGSVFRLAATVQIVCLKAAQSPFLSFVAWVSSDLVAFLVGVPAIWAFGLQGALWAYGLSGAVTLISAFILLRRMARHEAREQLRRSEEHTSELQSLRHLVCR